MSGYPGARSRAYKPTSDRSYGWMDHAACSGEDINLFFPPSAGEEHQPQIEQAKEICRRCPVRAECLEYALMLPIRHGIFGGLDEVERDLLRRRQLRRVA